jgi:hypothetical protein
MLVFGGAAQGGVTAELWAWNFQHWIHLAG